MSLATPASPEDFSTDVRLTLRIADGDYSLGQIAPDYIILDPPSSLPPGLGEVILSIDGRERKWPVELPVGSSPTTTRTPIRRL
jgi:hypothetical protein